MKMQAKNMGQSYEITELLGKSGDARISAVDKRLLSKAAMIHGKSLSEFIVTSAFEKACETVREHESLTLSVRDREAFVSALLNPPAPSHRLRKAARNYRAKMSAG